MGMEGEGEGGEGAFSRVEEDDWIGCVVRCAASSDDGMGDGGPRLDVAGRLFMLPEISETRRPAQSRPACLRRQRPLPGPYSLCPPRSLAQHSSARGRTPSLAQTRAPFPTSRADSRYVHYTFLPLAEQRRRQRWQAPAPTVAIPPALSPPHARHPTSSAPPAIAVTEKKRQASRGGHSHRMRGCRFGGAVRWREAQSGKRGRHSPLRKNDA